MTDALPELTGQPAELTADDFPMPDRHRLAMNALEQKMARIAHQMRPQWVEICRQASLGADTATIAEKVGVTPNTVRTALQRDPCRLYMGALAARREYLDGPSVQARAAMLWRIAQNNEDDAPRISISAVDVLNKTTGVYADQQRDLNANAPPTIQVINNFLLGGTPNDAKPVEKTSSDVIDGEFTPVTVDIPA